MWLMHLKQHRGRFYVLIGIKTTVTPSAKIPTPSWAKNDPPCKKRPPKGKKRAPRGSQRFKIMVFSAIFAFGELNLRPKLNWLTPAKLPAGSWGEYNLALCAAQNFAVSKKQFRCEVIQLMTIFQVYAMLIAKKLITVADSILLEKAKDDTLEKAGVFIPALNINLTVRYSQRFS